MQLSIAKNNTNLSLKPLILAMGISILSVSLIGCGGGDGSGNDNSGHGSSDTDNSKTGFTIPATWTVDGSKPGDTCYDLNTQAEIECTDDKWDIKFSNQHRSVKLWTNSGNSGDGKAAAYVSSWSDLEKLKNTQKLSPYQFQTDKAINIFTKKPWSAYDLQGNHKLFPNNRVYLITTDATNATTNSTASNPVYAMQIINYYDDSGKNGGYPTIRWIDTGLPAQVHTETINATSNNDWVYFNLKTGKTTDKAGDWHVGFKRSEVILNNGISGDGQVGGYLAKTPAGYYKDELDENGNPVPITAKFLENNIQASLTDLTQVSDYDISADGVPWEIDTAHSPLQLEKTGGKDTIDYGWYVYNATTHMLAAKPKDKATGAIIRSADGDSYARMYLEEIKYEVPNNPSSNTQWIYKLDIQPASK